MRGSIKWKAGFDFGHFSTTKMAATVAILNFVPLNNNTTNRDNFTKLGQIRCSIKRKAGFDFGHFSTTKMAILNFVSTQ